MLMFPLLFSGDETAIPAYDRFVRQIGRFDGRDPAGPKCQWTASAVEFRISGTGLKANIVEKGHDWLQVFVDGALYRTVTLTDGTQTVSLADGLNGPVHTVRVVKCTEPFVGTLQYLGFSVTDGKIMRPVPKKRRIEVIGDSISCGFGNLGKAAQEPFKPETEDGTQTYGAFAAAELDADYQCFAWSGRKMWPDNDIPSIYDLSIPTDPTSKWVFGEQIPDAVVINLATNDFGQNNPDEKGWTDAYKGFIARVRKNYPKAVIYPAIGSMMSDNWPPEHKALSTVRAYLTAMVSDINRAGDKNVHLVEFDVQNVEIDGVGAAWHPNVKTHHRMANVLIGKLRRDLGWK